MYNLWLKNNAFIEWEFPVEEEINRKSGCWYKLYWLVSSELYSKTKLYFTWQMFLLKTLQVRLNLNDVNNSNNTNTSRDHFIYVRNCLSKLSWGKNRPPEVRTIIARDLSLRPAVEKQNTKFWNISDRVVSFTLLWRIKSFSLCHIVWTKRRPTIMGLTFTDIPWGTIRNLPNFWPDLKLYFVWPHKVQQRNFQRQFLTNNKIKKK